MCVWIRSVVFVACLGVVSFPLSPSTSRAWAQPLPDRVPLEGVIVDENGRGIAGATLTLRRQNDDGMFGFWGAQGVTDEQGRFRVERAETGAYFLNVEAAGHTSQLNVSVTHRAGAEPLRLTLPRLTRVVVRVVDSAGRPVASEPFWVHLRSRERGEVRQQRLRTTSSGLLNLPTLSPGLYEMRLRGLAGFREEILDATVDISAGAAREIRLERGASLRVRLRDQNGTALGGARLTLTKLDENDQPGNAALTEDLRAGTNALVTRDGDGETLLEQVPPARYRLDATLSPFGSISRIVELRAGEEETLEIVPEFRIGVRLPLLLTTPEGAPFSGEVELRTQLLAPLGGSDWPQDVGMGDSQNRVARADEQGRVTIYPLRPGRYQFWITPRRAWGAPTVRATPMTIAVPPDGAPETKVVVPAMRGAANTNQPDENAAAEPENEVEVANE